MVSVVGKVLMVVCICRRADKIQSILRESGLKVATQDYEYNSAGNVHAGRNVYGVIQAPRGDGTEAIVLIAAWKTMEEEINVNGVTLALALARYFKSQCFLLSCPRCERWRYVD